MRGKQRIHRQYLLRDADLYLGAYMIASFLKDDLADLQQFGLTQENIDELLLLAEEYKSIPFEAESKAAIFSLKTSKDELRTELLEKMRFLTLRVMLKWGRNSQQYQRLEVANPSRMQENDLLQCSRNVVSKMNEYLPELLDYGLTQALIDEFETVSENYEEVITQLSDAKIQRKENTINRIEIGNKIYNLLLKYTSMGKSFYYETDSARYKLYLISHYKKKKYNKTKENQEEEPVS